MKDPIREELLFLIMSSAIYFPEERLTQLIMNACRSYPTWPDVWNVTDKTLIAGLKERLCAAMEEKK